MTDHHLHTTQFGARPAGKRPAIGTPPLQMSLLDFEERPQADDPEHRSTGSGAGAGWSDNVAAKENVVRRLIDHLNKES